MATAEEFISGAGARMDKSVEHARNEFNTVRTGRASTGLLDRITVDYYGNPTPLKQLANVAASDARLLTVSPFGAVWGLPGSAAWIYSGDWASRLQYAVGVCRGSAAWIH